MDLWADPVWLLVQSYFAVVAVLLFLSAIVSILLPPSFDLKQMEQKRGYTFPTQPRESYQAYWKNFCLVVNLRHHSLCTECVVSHMQLLLTSDMQMFITPVNCISLETFKCTGEPVTYQMSFGLLSAAEYICWKFWCCIWMCSSGDFRGISEYGLICLALSFNLLCKTLFFIQGKWEGIESRKVFAFSRRIDS